MICHIGIHDLAPTPRVKSYLQDEVDLFQDIYDLMLVSQAGLMIIVTRSMPTILKF